MTMKGKQAIEAMIDIPENSQAELSSQLSEVVKIDETEIRIKKRGRKFKRQRGDYREDQDIDSSFQGSYCESFKEKDIWP